jgi:hypothetical protein
MIDGEAVMHQALQGAAPPNWRVFPAKQSHFMGNIVGYVIGVVLLLGFIVFLIAAPDFVIGLRGAVNVPSLHSLWRTVDFVVAGVGVVGCIVLLVSSVRSLGTLNQQALVLLPEGFVIRKGADKKAMTVIEFGAISGIATSVSNGTWSLVMPRANGKGAVKLELDGRFGSPKQIAKMLEEARSQYAIARIGR